MYGNVIPLVADRGCSILLLLEYHANLCVGKLSRTLQSLSSQLDCAQDACVGAPPSSSGPFFRNLERMLLAKFSAPSETPSYMSCPMSLAPCTKPDAHSGTFPDDVFCPALWNALVGVYSPWFTPSLTMTPFLKNVVILVTPIHYLVDKIN